MEKILTISIAAYNVESFLFNTLDSFILSKPYMDLLEVIVVSDGSKDKTVEIANKFKQKYPNTFVVIDKDNGGYGSTINASIPIARGKYYKLVDGDDWVESSELEKLIDSLITSEADMILTKYCTVVDGTEETETIDCGYAFDNKEHKSNVLYGHSLPMHMIAVKTSILKNNTIHITEKCFYTDLEYVVKLLPHVHNVFLLDATVYMYRIGREEQSVSIRSWQKNVEQAIKVTYELSDYYGKIDEDISDQNMKRYILEKVSSSAINKYRILLSFPAKREVKERIKNYDKELSSVNPEIRRECSSNKLVLLLMIPGMPLYRLLSIIYRKHLRKKGLL